MILYGGSSGNRQQRLIGWLHVLIERIQQDGGGDVIAHQANDADELPVTKNLQGPGKRLGAHLMLAPRFAAELDSRGLLLICSEGRSAACSDINDLWTEA